jgi:adenosine deaminase
MEAPKQTVVAHKGDFSDSAKTAKPNEPTISQRSGIFGAKPLPLTELHIHAGGGLRTSAMWGIAHQQGIRLPFRDFWEFEDFLTITKEKLMDLDSFLYSDQNPFDWCERIQSSPLAMELTIYEMASKAYRSNHIETLEIRFTPMKRNSGGEQDLDHIIMGALRGMDRAMLEYPIKVGLIFCLEKNFSDKLNRITVEKAIKYRSRGIVGIDLAGLSKPGSLKAKEMAGTFKRAKDAGLGITVHAGEDEESLDVTEAIEVLGAERIGHGIRAVDNPDQLALIKEREVVIEFCPTSNLVLGLLDGIEGVRRVVDAFLSNDIKFTINTDDPVFFDTNLQAEAKMLIDHGILTPDQFKQCNRWAAEVSFLNREAPVT